MRYLVFLWASTPIVISGLYVFVGTQAEGGLALLALIAINKIPSQDAVSSIEHKVDHIAKVIVTNSDMFENYTRLHETNWDHDFPLRVDADMQKYGKLRMDSTSVASLVTQVGTVALTCIWVWNFFS
jgi:hypothetical protein